jgi:hypothetical protein
MNRTDFQKIAFALFLCMAFGLRLTAAEAGIIPEIGAHKPILTISKNIHPQNLMVVYTKVDATGHFVPAPETPHQPLLDFYWLMDGRNYKPVNALIKSEIRKRLQPNAADRANHFVINVNDLKEVNSDIKQPTLDIYVGGTGGDREVEAQMNLGPSDGNMRIRVSSIYTEGRAFPPAVYSVTLKGQEIINGKPTGKEVARKYEGKDKPNG